MRIANSIAGFTGALAALAVLHVRAETTPKRSADASSVKITVEQSKTVKPEKVALHDFAVERHAVGNIDYNQDRNVQVFAPYPGRIRQVFSKLGDDVKKGDPLFSIDSPDLIQAESAVIAAAGVLQLTTRALDRLQKMQKVESAAQKDIDQATSDQQTAAATLKGARDALRIFGKSEADIDRLIAERKVDGEFVIQAPIDGRITSRSAALGLLVQPGNTPAPFTLADISTMWMMGYLLEAEFPSLKLGNPVRASVSAYPGRTFEGRITAINTSVDPNTHRVAFRAEVSDQNHELLPQMITTVAIETGPPMHSPGLPVGGVVREGDGTMSVWVTQDGLTFSRREARVGVEQGGIVQILEGVAPGETAATDGALFLSTMATSGFGAN